MTVHTYHPPALIACPACVQEFKEQRLIHRRFAFEIILAAQAAFKTEPTLVDVSIPDDVSSGFQGVEDLRPSLMTWVVFRVFRGPIALGRCAGA